MQRRAGGPAPARQARSIANDARILDAAVDLADRDGWRALALAPVAEAAGLSRPAVMARFRDRPAIGAGAWSQRLNEPLHAALARLIDACSEPRSGMTADAMWSALQPFAHPNRELRAAAELLVVGRYNQVVGAAIQETLVPALAEWLNPGRGGDGRTRAAVRAHACNVALGLLIEARRHPLDGADFTIEMADFAAALANPATPGRLPRANARHLDHVANFDTGDDDLNDLLRATLEEISARGYEAATVDHIARAAGRTPGIVFSRYASKRELFLDANRRYSATASSLNEAFMRRIAEGSSLGIAEAAFTRELMRPERRRVMNVSLELYRLSWHDPEVLGHVDAGYEEVLHQRSQEAHGLTPAQAQAWQVMSLARGNGPLVLAGLSDTAWKLPYDVLLGPAVASG